MADGGLVGKVKSAAERGARRTSLLVDKALARTASVSGKRSPDAPGHMLHSKASQLGFGAEQRSYQQGARRAPDGEHGQPRGADLG